MKGKRPSWDEYFLNLTIDTSNRASCLKRDVGAVIVRDNRVLATGYNGAPRGVDPSCFDNQECWRRNRKIEHGRDKDLCMAVHAEANAIYQAARAGVSIDRATLYVTTFPCPSCAKGVISTGIVEVKYLFEYYGEQYDFSKFLLKKAKVKLEKLELPKNNEFTLEKLKRMR